MLFNFKAVKLDHSCWQYVKYIFGNSSCSYLKSMISKTEVQIPVPVTVGNSESTLPLLVIWFALKTGTIMALGCCPLKNVNMVEFSETFLVLTFPYPRLTIWQEKFLVWGTGLEPQKYNTRKSQWGDFNKETDKKTDIKTKQISFVASLSHQV